MRTESRAVSGSLSPSLWDAVREPFDEGSCAEPVEFVVLSSSSSGNCSALIVGSGRLRRVVLIDCGLSPLRTRVLLARLGLDFSTVDDVLVTHLDGDHFHAGWSKGLPSHTRLHMHRRHIKRFERMGRGGVRPIEFEDVFALRSGICVRPMLLEHDEWGVAAFRFETGGASLGYATDVGRVTRGLIEGLRGVDVLAIESNYCPLMQEASDRPAFLKDRITGGRGHLSNEECARATRAIGPLRAVVLLHLSRECNRAEAALAGHEGAAYRTIAAGADQPTDVICVRGVGDSYSPAPA